MGEKKIASEQSFEIPGLFSEYWSFFSEASKNPEYFCKNLSTEDFIKFVSMRGLRSRGVDIENRIRIKNNWSTVARNCEAGDLIDREGNYVEVKSSIVTPNKGSKVTLRGFRKWETEVKYYIIVIMDIRSFKVAPEWHIFRIEPGQMHDEPKLKPYNQSKRARDGKNILLGIDLKINDPLFMMWKSNFIAHDINL